ncbi:MAG TPA: ATP/GTP-binding protein [Deinococcales bacterium]|nr:ATP/GTP-binding protein [Deinococcales bacterium]
MKPLKLVIAGPVAAGKTTFVRTLSTTEVVNTDEAATEEIGKDSTTVAMDFGTLNLDGIPLQLFGTPGQERFDFMWEVLSEGALGLIMLVHGQRPADFPRARDIFEFITSRIPVPFLIGVTHQDLEPVWAPDEVADYFGVDHNHAIGLNATNHASAYRVLAHLVRNITEQEETGERTI